MSSQNLEPFWSRARGAHGYVRLRTDGTRGSSPPEGGTPLGRPFSWSALGSKRGGTSGFEQTTRQGEFHPYHPEYYISSIFKASIAGANARILLDSGAAADCISLKLCELMKLKIQPIAGADISTVSGQSEQVVGTATVTISTQSYKSKRRMLVIPMALDCDAILGEPWHASIKAVTQWGTTGLQCVRVYKGRTMRKLVQQTSPPMNWEPRPPQTALLSHLQFGKATRHNKYFVAYVKCADEPGGKPAPSPTGETTEQQPTQNLLVHFGKTSKSFWEQT